MNQPPQQSPYGNPVPPTTYGGYPANMPPPASQVPPMSGQQAGWPGNYQPAQPPSSPNRTPLIVGGALLAVAIIGVFLFFTVFRGAAAPPSSWIANYSDSDGTYVYYMHWDNNNGQLKGFLTVAIYDEDSDKIQELPLSFTGTYNSQNHTVELSLDLNQDGDKAIGTITGDTLILTSNDEPDDKITFHAGSEADYEQAKNNLKK